MEFAKTHCSNNTLNFKTLLQQNSIEEEEEEVVEEEEEDPLALDFPAQVPILSSEESGTVCIELIDDDDDDDDDDMDVTIVDEIVKGDNSTHNNSNSRLFSNEPSKVSVKKAINNLKKIVQRDKKVTTNLNKVLNNHKKSINKSSIMKAEVIQPPMKAFKLSSRPTGKDHLRSPSVSDNHSVFRLKENIKCKRDSRQRIKNREVDQFSDSDSKKGEKSKINVSSTARKSSRVTSNKFKSSECKDLSNKINSGYVSISNSKKLELSDREKYPTDCSEPPSRETSNLENTSQFTIFDNHAQQLASNERCSVNLSVVENFDISISDILLSAWKIAIDEKQEMRKGKRKVCECKLIHDSLNIHQSLLVRRVCKSARFACCKLRVALLGKVYYVPKTSISKPKKVTSVSKLKKKVGNKIDSSTANSGDNDILNDNNDVLSFDRLLEMELQN